MEEIEREARVNNEDKAENGRNRKTTEEGKTARQGARLRCKGKGRTKKREEGTTEQANK